MENENLDIKYVLSLFKELIIQTYEIIHEALECIPYSSENYEKLKKMKKELRSIIDEHKKN